MSDNESTAKTGEKPLFTPKEEAIMKIAWRCLKSGPPEIDMEKLTKLGGFNTAKTATNTWGVIKKKLFTDSDGNALPATPKKGGSEPATPKSSAKKAAATPKKRAKKAAADDDDDSDGEAITLGSRKRSKQTPLKKEVKSEESEEE